MRTVSYAGFSTRELAVVGVPPTVVFLHGYLDSADTWREVLGGFPHTAVAVDLPGFGAADRLGPGEMLPQLDRFVDGILDVLGPVVLVGNSLGAYLSLRAAARRPTDVLAVVAAASPEMLSGAHVTLARSWVAALLAPGVGRFVRIPRPVTASMSRLLVSRLVYGDPAAARPEVVRRWERTFASAGRVRRIPGELISLARESRTSYDRSDLAAPVLLVQGRRDRLVSLRAATDLHAALPGSRLEVLPSAGHCPQHDDPGHFANLVTGFIFARVDQRGAGHSAWTQM